MAPLRILTAGESHGKALAGILEGMPAGLKLDREKIENQMRRRQAGFGRGDRMQIEADRVEILSGLRFGVTLGAPIAVLVPNRDWENWKSRMNVWEGKEDDPVHIPRPGHADLAGAVKYGFSDMRNVLERASARETAVRVAIGAIVRQLLEHFGVWIGSQVIQIHSVKVQKTFRDLFDSASGNADMEILKIAALSEASELRCAETAAEQAMKERIRQAGEAGNTVGGAFETVALNVPVGLGSHVISDRRLDAVIASEFMSIPAIKSVEIGLGGDCASRFGSEVHDPILPGDPHPIRPSNRAGGIEGGISNGEPILVRAAMKPIPTLKKPLPSVNLATGEPVAAHHERSDVCAVPAAAVVGEAVMSVALGKAFMDRYGGDTVEQIQRQFDGRKQ
jgi:chorismate synthase